MGLASSAKGLYRLALLLIVCAGVARIASTYPVFNQTVDEGSHIACGMQLMQDRQYFMDQKHPPLGRIAVALGPYLEGARLPGAGRSDNMFELGNEILNWKEGYWRNLTLARLGTLPFFLLACAVVWFWSDHISGKRAALFSLLIFTLLPSILAHSGLATNDMAGAATLCLALYCFTRWMENPSWRASAWLGVGVGLAVASKFSALLFLPGCVAALILLYFVAPTDSSRQHPWVKLASKIAVSLLIAYAVLWASYLFTLTPIQASRPHTVVDRLLVNYPVARHAAYAVLETPILAGNVAAGMKGLSGQNKAGQAAFFLGEWRRHGWWYFFPVIFLLKTPLAFFLLCCIGAVFLARSYLRQHDWRIIAPVVFALVVLALSMTSGINIGSRHILAMYPLLSIAAGHAASALWNAARRSAVGRVVAAGTLLWLLASSVLAHPDYLAYFNCLASRSPERIEVDSDVDWGQDLARLSRWLRVRGIQDVALSYFGTTDLTHAGLGRFHELVPYQKTTGWVAISARNRVIPSPFVVLPTPPGTATYYSVPGNFGSVKPGTGPFAWLMAYKPTTRIGKSIFVYYIPPD